MIARFFFKQAVLLSLAFTPFCLGRVIAAETLPELVIYTYDSFLTKDGLGAEIFPLFEKKCSCRVRAIAVGDGAQLLTRLQLDHERGKLGAQIVLGLDQQIWDRARPWTDPWSKWEPIGYSKLAHEFQIEKGFLPFDYSVFAFMADRQALHEAGLSVPRSLRDLLKPEWKRNFIFEDPRTSTPGLAFVLYSKIIFSDSPSFDEFWKSLKGRWLTISPGWDQAYGLFLKKEAPLVWSYTTSQAYHEEHGDSPHSRKYEAVLFEEGQPLQIEGAALVKGVSASPEKLQLAQNFLEFLISPEVQRQVPLKNWMLPVVKKTSLPESFAHLPHPKKVISIQKKSNESQEILSRWRAIIQSN